MIYEFFKNFQRTMLYNLSDRRTTMLLSCIWTALVAVSIAAALFTGTSPALASAALEGAQTGITLTISMAGALCLWSGLARVMEAAGISAAVARVLRPLLRRLFPEAAEDPRIFTPLCGNFTANLLGLGNAATPLGVQAVTRMRQNGEATDEMCRLIVLNTASIQLIPATVAAVRASLGCARPFDILPAVWITSLCSAGVGVAAAAIFGKVHRRV